MYNEGIKQIILLMAQLLIINPGSTSTKMAIFEDDHIIQLETVSHPVTELERYPCIWKQFPYRLELCQRWASQRLKSCSAVVAIGGLSRCRLRLA